MCGVNLFPWQRHVMDGLFSVDAGGKWAATEFGLLVARHAGAEEADTSTSWESLGEVKEPDLSSWSAYQHGQSFVDAVLAGTTARASWQIAPGDDWQLP